MASATPALMIQATGSNAGKSTLVAGLARALVRRGMKVAPFKPQNMSNNAAVAVEGGEIGRAQAVQARAARMTPSVHMNPVLLKPETDSGSQVIVQGKRWGTLRAKNYLDKKAALLPAVLDSFARLAREADIVLVEGAGSPAEINLRAGDIANMGFAAAADVPVVLAGDIDRGGVIASLAGTHLVLEPDERARIRGFVINKFRGDVRLFDQRSRRGDAIDRLALARCGAVAAAGGVAAGGRRRRSRPRPQLGVVARDRGADAGAHRQFRRSRSARHGGRASNWCSSGRARQFPANADVVILPGSKSTIGDLAFLRAQGWDIDIKAHVRRGGHVLGLCGGYQMLGQTIADPEGIEGPAATVEGLGLLDISTVMSADKSTRLVQGIHCATGTAIEGYEIHLGRSEGPDCARPVVTIDGRPDGASTADGRVQGTYVHGLFTGDAFRKAWLANLGIASSLAYASANRIRARCAGRSSGSASGYRGHAGHRAQPSDHQRQRGVDRRLR